MASYATVQIGFYETVERPSVRVSHRLTALTQGGFAADRSAPRLGDNDRRRRSAANTFTFTTLHCGLV